jgi:hypothetical protein
MGVLEDGIGAAVDTYACLHHSLQTLRTFWQRLDVLEEPVLPCAFMSAPAQSRGCGGCGAYRVQAAQLADAPLEFIQLNSDGL